MAAKLLMALSDTGLGMALSDPRLLREIQNAIRLPVKMESSVSPRVKFVLLSKCLPHKLPLAMP